MRNEEGGREGRKKNWIKKKDKELKEKVRKKNMERKKSSFERKRRRKKERDWMMRKWIIKMRKN